MNMKSKQRLQGLLREAVMLLCKTGLQYKNCFSVDALIGITTDDTETFLVKLEDKLVDGDVDGKTDNNEDDDSVHSATRCLSSRKRPVVGIASSAPAKRRRADSHVYSVNENCNTDNTYISTTADQQEDDVVTVKVEETSDGEHHDTQLGTDNYQSHVYEVVPDGNYVDCSPDASSARDRSTANNNANASESQEVCVISFVFYIKAMHTENAQLMHWMYFFISLYCAAITTMLGTWYAYSALTI